MDRSCSSEPREFKSFSGREFCQRFPFTACRSHHQKFLSLLPPASFLTHQQPELGILPRIHHALSHFCDLIYVIMDVSNGKQVPASELDLPNLTLASGDDLLSATDPAQATEAALLPHLSHDPESNLKRSDPFQFGSRFLGEKDNVFEFNAWDHVETDDTYKEYAEEQYAKQREAPVSDFDKSTFPIFTRYFPRGHTTAS
jgi:hypothetical protein